MSKRKLNLSIEEDLIKYIKCIAISENKSVSDLVAEYIKSIKKSNKAVIKAIQDINNK